MTATRPPVTDWATDWDFLDPRWVEDPTPIWDELRRTCPIAHTERFDGSYLPTTYKDIRDIAYDTATFSSRKAAVRENATDVRGGAPPITSDPPLHRAARMVLLPPFTPDAVKKLEGRARAICNELIDTFLAKAQTNSGKFDGAVDYAQHIPVRIIARMLGVPEADGDLFRRWIGEILQDGTTDPDILRRANIEMRDYFATHLADRRVKPGDDLISYLSQQHYENGAPFKDNHVIGSVGLLLVAGIDTTWSGIGSSIWHLAKTPADRDRLIAEPQLMPAAIEEFLRAYSPVTMGREIVQDTVVNGCPMHRGQTVLMSYPAANRDPAMFPDADKVLIDRKVNRHAAFGLGIHRCVGSNLARMEMTVAVEELLKRVPKLRLDGKVTWSDGTVRGPRILPLAVASMVKV
jgi:cytochrome P450